MSEFKGTPGPWVQDKWGNVKRPDGSSVLFGGLSLALSSNDEIRANDRLVCVAPELLEAMQALVEHGDAWENSTAYRDSARAQEYLDKFLALKESARVVIASALGKQ